MPTTNPRPCKTPRCPGIAHHRGLCPACARNTEATRNTARTWRLAFYKSAAWRRHRAQLLRTHPQCAEPGCHNPATDIDHDPELTEHDPDPFRETTGRLLPLCHAHHARKTSLTHGRGAPAPEPPRSRAVRRVRASRSRGSRRSVPPG